MRILHVTAQKPSSTGSGIYLTQLIRAMDPFVCSDPLPDHPNQAVLFGAYEDDLPFLEKSIGSYAGLFPVCFNTPELPFAIPGMSDVMPYPSTQYRSMTADDLNRYCSRFCEAANEAVTEFDPDVIICHHLYILTSLIREEFPDIPVYGFCHNTDLTQFQSHDLAHPLIQRAIPKLDGIFALQNEQMQRIIRVLGVSADMIRVTGAGYDPAVFFDDGSRLRSKETWFCDGQDDFRIVFAGKLSAAKGVPSLIRAMSVVSRKLTDLSCNIELHPHSIRECFRDYLLTLAGSSGDPDEYGEITELAGRCPYTVAMPGRVSQEKLAEFYRAGDLFILPSFNEGLPLCVIEALACGMRVIMTDLPGIRDWISSHIEHAPVTFIPLPFKIEQQIRTSGTCDPSVLDEDDLADFEDDLAEAVIDASLAKPVPAPDLSALTWSAVAKRILTTICVS